MLFTRENIENTYAESRFTSLSDAGGGDNSRKYETFKPINGGNWGAYTYYANGSLKNDSVKNTGEIVYK